MMESYVLEMRDITKRFPGITANKRVNLRVRPGEIHGLVGENGAGKSTLLKVLNGIHPHGSYEGAILLNGQEMSFRSPHDAQGKGIGFVPQEINVLENLSVSENIFVGNLTRGSAMKGVVSFARVHRMAQELLDRNKINLRARVLVKSLSVGQKQLLMIARALSKDPKVLILDEPTSSLTLDQVDNLFAIMRQLTERGTSIVFVTHKINEILQITDRVSVMCDGRSISTFSREEYHPDTIITDMIGRTIETLYPTRSTVPGGEVLRVVNLAVDHPKIRDTYLVRDISFSLKKGEVLGFAGLIGAGRSEVLGAVYGTLKKASGEVFVNGKKVAIQSEHDAIRNGISMVSEDRKKDGLMFLQDIKGNISVNNLRAVSTLGCVRKAKEAENAGKYFRQLAIRAPSIATSVLALSGGNQQKVVIGRALNIDPLIILLDEPTKGIDVGSKNEIYTIINELSAQGVSIVMVSSELPELLAMCDRFVVMANGTISREFTKSEADEVGIMRAATV
jgi:ABC-type sugar transport system ATPase subunit